MAKKSTIQPASFTAKNTGILRIISTEVHVLPAYGDNDPIVVPTEQDKGRAIWDTGAEKSVISTRVAQKMGLVPTGMIHVAGVHGVQTVNTYMVAIYLPNKIVLPSLTVSEGDLGDNLDVLIGMDIISSGDFALTNRKGQTWFTFRMPSMQRFDFVQVKIKEDAGCTCGSGRQYKNCCK